MLSIKIFLILRICVEVFEHFPNPLSLIENQRDLKKQWNITCFTESFGGFVLNFNAFKGKS